MENESDQSTILPWHRKAAKEITSYYSPSKYAQNLDTPEVASIIARHDPHVETLRLLEEMIEEEVEGPFFHEDEHGPESVLNRARAHLAAMKGSK